MPDQLTLLSSVPHTVSAQLRSRFLHSRLQLEVLTHMPTPPRARKSTVPVLSASVGSWQACTYGSKLVGRWRGFAGSQHPCLPLHFPNFPLNPSFCGAGFYSFWATSVRCCVMPDGHKGKLASEGNGGVVLKVAGS
jgi:hypothetical protein